MKTYRLFICAVLSFWGTTLLYAQSGDQILDGIGETGLIARYVFDDDIKDWSRNNLHGKLPDTKAKFVKDKLFGHVLSLNNNAFISIPGTAVSGEESLSIIGWVYLRSNEQGQYIFDFGKSNSSHFSLTPTGTKDNPGCQAKLMINTKQVYIAQSEALETEKWHHIAVVFNAPSKSVSIYVNAKPVATTQNVNTELKQLFANNTNENNSFFFGKSLSSNSSSLNAKLYDFRIYRIPLSTKQIKRIHNSALKKDSVVNEREEPDGDLPKFSETTAQLYNSFLTQVPNINVDTEIGHLPRLPRHVNGVFSNAISPAKVRVIWPAPTDNTKVQKAGQYTVTGYIAGSDLKPKAIVTVKAGEALATPDRKLEAFHLNQVTLNTDTHGHDTKFIENRDKFISTLANTNPDNFLYMFRNAFGQEQPKGAKPLGVWDSQETKLRGHATGHYLTAIAQAYLSTSYDKALQTKFADKMAYMVNTLYELSQLSGQALKAGDDFVSDPKKVPPGPAKPDYNSDLSEANIRTDYWNWGKGFISAYPPDQFIMLEKGAKYGTENTKVWAPYYTLHKILAGLMDVYEISGNEKALDIVKGMGDWVHARLSELPTETLISMWNTYIAGEFGGMNEAMARLYSITKTPRYLETAQLFDNVSMFFGNAQHAHGLAKNVDTFRGLHANQHIPQIMGALEMYHGSHAPEYYHVADNFWYKATNDYMYSIGGVAGARHPANAECFTREPATIYENGLSAGGQNETCATYNMLKLSKNLFLYDQRAELMDYYERGLYNHILASVAENSPANTYHVPLRPGSVKHFGNPDMSGFTCCNGTAIESNTKLQTAIYFKSPDNRSLYVNLFVPSTLDWTEKHVTIEQTTSFPYEDHTQLTVTGKGKFALHIRVPHWATKGFFVLINGKKQKVKATPGSYLTLNRKWKNGDIIKLQMPFQFHLDPVMDQQNIASLFYGPVLLAAQETEPQKDWRKITLDRNDIGKSITGDPTRLQFTIDGILFKPFYETYGRHSVYLDVTLK